MNKEQIDLLIDFAKWLDLPGDLPEDIVNEYLDGKV